MKEDVFLKACFYNQLKEENGYWIIGDGNSHLFKIDDSWNGKKNDDNEYVLKMKWHKKEWLDGQWSKVTLKFKDHEDLEKKSHLKFKQTKIPTNDKHGNPDQAELMKGFWKQSVFKGLTVKETDCVCIKTLL